MRCLIVDDDLSPRVLITKLITDSGHYATGVASGKDAVHALASQQFDVAIVDMEMPGKSGAATIADLRAIAPELRVLVVSGYDDRRRVLAAFDAGADGYLVKDELGDSLASSLQSLRAGHTPMSPRVASIVVRKLRSMTANPVPKPARIGCLTRSTTHDDNR